MKLHRIRVKDFGRHESCELTFNPDGITIINGPNEAGKSSLMRALYYILEEKQTHQRDLKSFIREGKKGFEIEADIESGEYRFVLTRRYYLKETNSLEILQPKRENVDPAAIDEKLLSIMRETMDMDLWRALNKLQGVDSKDVSASGKLADALTKASGEVVDGGIETSYMELVDVEASAYFNANGKENKELAGRRNDLKKMGDDVAEIRREISEADAYLEDLEMRSGRRSRLEIEIANQRSVVKETAGQFVAAKALASDLKGAEDAAKKHRDLAGLLRQRLQDRRADEKGIQEMRGQIAALGTRLLGLPSLEATEKEKAKTAIAAAERSTAEKACLENAGRAHQDLDHLRRLNDLGLLQEKLRSVEDSREKAKAAEEELRKNAATEDMMKQIIAANNKVQSAEGALTSKMPSIHLEAISSVDVRIAGEMHNMASGDILGRPVDGKLEVVLPGTMRIVVISSTEEKPQVKLENARAALTKLLSDCGVVTVEQAQAASRRRVKIESELERAEEQIKRVLGKEKVEEIEARAAQMTSLIDAYKQEREGSTLPSDLDQAEELLKAEEKAHRSAVKEAERAAKAAKDAAEALAKLNGEMSGLEGQKGVLESTVAEREEALRRSREIEGDEEMANKSENAETEQQRLDAQVNGMRARAAGLKPEDLGVIAQDAEAALQAMLDKEKENNGEMQRLNGRLEGKADEGAEERLGESVAKLERAQREFSALLRRAQAAQLLKRVMEEEKSKAMLRYKQPLKQRVEEMGKLLHGATFSIAMDDDLNITGRSLDGKSLDFGKLSEGAKEQLGIMLCLACADVVAPVCGIPLILDDPLSNTDPRRLRVMNSLLSLAGSKGQLILITCNPDKYAGIGNAKRVEMT